MPQPLTIPAISVSQSTTGAVSTGIELHSSAVSFNLDADTVAQAIADEAAAVIRESIARGVTPEGKPLGHSKRHVPGLVSGHLRDGIQSLRAGDGDWRIVYPDDREDYLRKLDAKGSPLIVSSPEMERRIRARLDELAKQAWSDGSPGGQIERSLRGG